MIFEIDAKLVVDAIHAKNEDGIEFGYITHHCRLLLDLNNSYLVGYAWRQVNEIAYVLTKVSHFYSCLFISFEHLSVLQLPLKNICSNR